MLAVGQKVALQHERLIISTRSPILKFIKLFYNTTKDEKKVKINVHKCIDIHHYNNSYTYYSDTQVS